MNKAEERNLIKVATLYYKEGLTQVQISKKLGVSRSLISKWLVAARNQGFIEFFFNSEEVYSVELENKLEEKFGLKSATVIDTNNLSSSEIEKVLGQTGALAIKGKIENVQSIGLSWGKSIKALVTQFPFESYSDKVFIPLIGGMGINNFDIHSNQLCYEFARKTRSSSKYLYTPALVSNPAIRKEFENNEYIHEILEEAKQVDLAIVSISSPYHINTMQEIGYLSETDIQELYDLHVVGDINSRFFDKDGVEVNHVTNTNVIGIGIEDLKKIPQVVALAYHEDKWSGVYYSCKNHLITDLITTDVIAKQILKAEL
ncbi:sugar-binding transcriptional regulator [Enterococcus hulanensis]|uniref:Sugar-binding transcriptional regulator n=1 Tax=Enterococcus hulanensis TaxID=2559929 RepID=A0ABU3EU94_9ENTE|nr:MULTISPECIES: sugar-binding transcriptional regulator [Enterococcus]MBX8939065.1 sugar-binding transcriptional regulator [Enterococcus gilvus]MDT2598436.1 sugar-binding transcriptional regulator [Enterococcus hulanensis]MDT2608059.1 sugar-binding transcriptional regulator [Enterococcus hulanensis]MDT2615354.1 sugar-binding transcriptional regulator [Enterococcus hulanensis]MDT2626675.1 sugar-binding transcriptional regulator [Enterococcus hulanensis]